LNKLHYFYPENDLALAAGVANYTAPSTTVALRRAGALLPMWYGSPDDAFICDGVNAAWFDRIEKLFGPKPAPVASAPDGYAPAPWGWSASSRRLMALYGVSTRLLPSDAALARIRELSHRRTAAEISRQLSEALSFATVPPAVECRDTEAVAGFIDAMPCCRAVLKAPWSSSGRGIIFVDTSTREAALRSAAGIIRRQGSVMAEVRLERAADFAMLFEMDGNGGCRTAGLSLFSTAPAGAYLGNTLASDTQIAKILTQHCNPAQLDAIARTLPAILSRIIGDAYTGPLGIDMLIATDGTIAPCVEMNLRMTMGHVARRLADSILPDGACGFYSVVPSKTAVPGSPRLSGTDTFSTFNGRLTGGTLELCPSGAFSFRVGISDN